MLQGKDLILATKTFAQEIRWKSWFHALTTFGVLGALLWGTFGIPFIAVRIVCSILAGLVLIRTFIIYHDYQHHAILNKSFPGKIIFSIFGMYILAPPSIWKRSHDYHHNHNSKLFSASIGSYPIMTKEKFLSATKKEQREYLFTRHPITIFFGYISMFINGMCIQSFKSSPRRHWDSLLALVLHFGAGIFIGFYAGWVTSILSFFLPLFIAHLFGAYLFYAQHNFPGVSFRNNVEWNYAKAALESSSYMKMNAVWAWLTGNIGYHHVHHLNSRIPFYRLPEAMAKMPELQNVKITTFNPSDIWACLKLKLWDPEQEKMVGLDEVRFAQPVNMN